MTPSDVSVIIPTLNEESTLVRSIESARAAGAGEIIVCDGGSTDQTWGMATQAGVDKLVRSLPGRGMQLAAGLSLAKREVVLFLHADNQIDKQALNQIGDLDAFVWGAFQQRIDSDRLIYRAIELGNDLRVRFRSMAFGDQAIFVNRLQLRQLGGIAELPLMEDVELSKRLRKIAKPVLLPGPVTIDARRWQQRGVIRQTCRNWKLQLQYAAGVSPQRLAKKY